MQFLLSLYPVDSSVVDLRNALVHMIAVVLGCPSQSNHLWYHMFAPEELTSTHITGFMVRTRLYTQVNVPSL